MTLPSLGHAPARMTGREVLNVLSRSIDDERAACAAIADQVAVRAEQGGLSAEQAHQIAARIRARGTT